jgi:hypothetical protein
MGGFGGGHVGGFGGSHTAGLSHATRAMSSKSGNEWPEVNSFNLDDMIKQPLPSVDRQMTNLLAWAATELDDDQLGSVELPDEDDLTGIVPEPFAEQQGALGRQMA